MKSIMLVIGLVVIGLLVAFGLLRTENRKESDAMNALMVIVPYKYEGLWVFDDAAVGLSKEPFIAGIDTLIDKATASIPDAQHGFRAIFNGAQFPGANFKLEGRRAESGGNWYYSPEFNQEGWLCRALFKYFKSAPPEIYVKVEPRNEGLSPTRCFNSQTRSAARSNALVRARVPAAGRSREADIGLVEPLRDRPFGLRALAFVLRTRLAA